MTRALPDVNVLLALLWPRHESHLAAHAWFAKTGSRAWATNTLTELGVLRLLTNPAVTQGTVNAATAVDVLSEATRHPGHQFWPLDQDVARSLSPLAGRVTGHQQWTDALLLCQAAQRKGVLVTFDTGVRHLENGDLGASTVLLKRR